MNPIYYNCSKWEDLKNGMMRSCSQENDENLFQLSVDLLSNPEKLSIQMRRVINEWVYASKERLTKIDTNRRAWLGWAACCINHKSPDFITRKAWGFITEENRNIANLIAETIILEFECRQNKEKVCQLNLWE